MTIFSNLLKSDKSDESAILNSGLHFSMEFGKDWMQPVQNRLKRKYGHLTKEQLDHYDAVCRKTREKACNFIYERLMALCHNQETIRRKALKDSLNGFISEHYAWISVKNRRSLFSQGLYYAWKDGWDTCIKG